MAFTLYEFTLTMILTIVFNILAVAETPLLDDKTSYLDTGATSINFSLALFVLTMIAWDVAPAQFNSALALGQMLFEAELGNC